jgi:hypothetical protein
MSSKNLFHKIEKGLRVNKKFLTRFPRLRRPMLFVFGTGLNFLVIRSSEGARDSSYHEIRFAVRWVMGGLYAYPCKKSIRHFMEQIRKRTRPKAPVRTEELIEGFTPVIRRWGNYYYKTNVRKLFNDFDRWILRRIWSYRYKGWRYAGWKTLPEARGHGEMGLVNLVSLIPMPAHAKERSFVEVQCGKTVRWV